MTMELEIQRKEGVGGTYVTIDTIPFTDGEYVDTSSLTINTLYYYRIREVIDGVPGEWKAEYSVWYLGPRTLQYTISTTPTASTKSLTYRIKTTRVSNNLLPINVANGTENTSVAELMVVSGCTLTSSTEQAWQGSRSIKCVTAGAADFERWRTPYCHVPRLKSYTISCYLRGSGTIKLVALEATASGSYLNASDGITITLDSTWTRYSLTRTFTYSTGRNVGLMIATASQQVATYYVDGLQVEAGAASTTWTLPAIPAIPLEYAILTHGQKKAEWSYGVPVGFQRVKEWSYGLPYIVKETEPLDRYLVLYKVNSTHTYSNLFTDVPSYELFQWTNHFTTVTPATGIAAPYGCRTKPYKLLEDTATAEHCLGDVGYVFAGKTYTCVMYAKGGLGRDWVAFQTHLTTGWLYTYFDITNGVIGTVPTGHTATITNVGDGWYRCTVSAVSAATELRDISINIALGTLGPVFYAGDAAKGVYIWGAEWYRSDCVPSERIDYYISRTPTAGTKSLQYKILSAKVDTKNLDYDIRSVPTLTKGLQYTIVKGNELNYSLEHTILTSKIVQGQATTTVFEDDFATGDFSKWDDTNTSELETGTATLEVVGEQCHVDVETIDAGDLAGVSFSKDIALTSWSKVEFSYRINSNVNPNGACRLTIGDTYIDMDTSEVAVWKTGSKTYPQWLAETADPNTTPVHFTFEVDVSGDLCHLDVTIDNVKVYGWQDGFQLGYDISTAVASATISHTATYTIITTPGASTVNVVYRIKKTTPVTKSLSYKIKSTHDMQIEQVINGSFETGDFTGWTQNNSFVTNAGWVEAPDGTWVAMLYIDAGTYYYYKVDQNVNLTNVNTLTFYTRYTTDWHLVTVDIDGAKILDLVTSDGLWHQDSYDVSGYSGSHNIAFKSPLGGFLLDKVSALATPSLQYTIAKNVKVDCSLSYAIKSSVVATKGLEYVISGGTALFKSLQYTIWSVPSAITKNVAYTIDVSKVIQSTTQYVIKLQTVINSGVQYAIKKSVSIPEGLQYVIQHTIITPVQATYEIIGGTVIQDTLTYTIKVVKESTIGLAYVITKSSIVTESLQYVVKAAKLTTLGLEYQIAGRVVVLTTKGLKYTIFTSTLATKGLQYIINRTTIGTKLVSYVIIKSVPINVVVQYKIKVVQLNTKGLQYVINVQSTLSKQLSYIVKSIHTTQDTLKYTIFSSQLVNKGLQYIINRPKITTVALAYIILASKRITRSLSYALHTIWTEDTGYGSVVDLEVEFESAICLEVVDDSTITMEVEATSTISEE